VVLIGRARSLLETGEAEPEVLSADICLWESRAAAPRNRGSKRSGMWEVGSPRSMDAGIADDPLGHKRSLEEPRRANA
jgi:hypothetical protein